jgi:hypothetical protein
MYSTFVPFKEETEITKKDRFQIYMKKLNEQQERDTVAKKFS